MPVSSNPWLMPSEHKLQVSYSINNTESHVPGSLPFHVQIMVCPDNRIPFIYGAEVDCRKAVMAYPGTFQK